MSRMRILIVVWDGKRKRKKAKRVKRKRRNKIESGMVGPDPEVKSGQIICI